MFALAARYSDPDDLRQLNQDAAKDDNRYVEEAQALLSEPNRFLLHFHRCAHVLSIIDKTFRASRLSTCQALLLLGYGAIGLSMIVFSCSVTVALNPLHKGGLQDASLFLSKN